MDPRLRGDDVDVAAVVPPANTHITKLQTKKSRPAGRLLSNRAKNYLAADAAAEAAVEAAAEAAAAASAATEAADAATAAAEAASAAGVSTTGAAGAAAGASTAGAGATTGSSFLQAVRARASRETISKDFFMGFSLINSQKYRTLLR
jgi:hypothetical protein